MFLPFSLGRAQIVEFLFKSDLFSVEASSMFKKDYDELGVEVSFFSIRLVFRALCLVPSIPD